MIINRRAMITTAIASIIATAGMIYFGSMLRDSSELSVDSDIIDSASLKFGKNKIFLDIRVNKPISCDDATKAFGIESFTVKERSYSPSCELINESLIRITYTEEIST